MVRQRRVWPGAGIAAVLAMSVPGQEHWAFRPLERVAPPDVPGLAADSSAIDRFVGVEGFRGAG